MKPISEKRHKVPNWVEMPTGVAIPSEIPLASTTGDSPKRQTRWPDLAEDIQAASYGVAENMLPEWLSETMTHSLVGNVLVKSRDNAQQTTHMMERHLLTQESIVPPTDLGHANNGGLLCNAYDRFTYRGCVTSLLGDERTRMSGSDLKLVIRQCLTEIGLKGLLEGTHVVTPSVCHGVRSDKYASAFF